MSTLAAPDLKPMHAEPVIRDDAVEHVKYAVANAPLCTYPYEHLHVRNVWPADYYRDILAHFPEPDRFTAKIPNYPLRGTIDLLDGQSIKAMDGARRDFWSDLVRRLTEPSFMAFVLERYSPLLASRFREVVRPMMYLFHDAGGYGIGPHSDTTYKLVTNLFYLPEDDALRDCGTSIVIPKNPAGASRFLNSPHMGWADFTPVKTVDFEPNALLSFVVSDRSLHAVRPTRPGAVRNSLQYFFVLPS